MFGNQNPFLELLAVVRDEDKDVQQQAPTGLRPRPGKVQVGERSGSSSAPLCHGPGGESPGSEPVHSA